MGWSLFLYAHAQRIVGKYSHFIEKNVYLWENNHTVYTVEHKELVSKLQRRLNVDADRVEAMIENFSSIVTERCSQMDTIMIQGLGTFEARKKMERIAVNPATGKRMLIPPKIVLVFKPNNAIKNRLKDIKQ